MQVSKGADCEYVLLLFSNILIFFDLGLKIQDYLMEWYWAKFSGLLISRAKCTFDRARKNSSFAVLKKKNTILQIDVVHKEKGLKLGVNLWRRHSGGNWL